VLSCCGMLGLVASCWTVEPGTDSDELRNEMLELDVEPEWIAELECWWPDADVAADSSDWCLLQLMAALWAGLNCVLSAVCDCCALVAALLTESVLMCWNLPARNALSNMHAAVLLNCALCCCCWPCAETRELPLGWETWTSTCWTHSDPWRLCVNFADDCDCWLLLLLLTWWRYDPCVW